MYMNELCEKLAQVLLTHTFIYLYSYIQPTLHAYIFKNIRSQHNIHHQYPQNPYVSIYASLASKKKSSAPALVS